MMKYQKKTAHGFTWTRDFSSGRDGYCVHRLYFEGFHDYVVATIQRVHGQKNYTLRPLRGASARYNELARAKRIAENYATKNWKKLGFKLVREK